MFDDLISIPATVIRGGTSKGVYLLEEHMPVDRSMWAPYLMAMFGSGHARQIDGIGGAETGTSKCCIVGRGRQTGIDVTYTFAQVGIADMTVNWDVNCGNLTAGVGLFAAMSGLVKLRAHSTRIAVYQTNTQRVIHIDLPSPSGIVPIEGPLAIGGVPDSGARIGIDLSATAGASLDKGVFPTGRRTDSIAIDGLGVIDCTIVDVANMCVFFRAEDIGCRGTEGVDQGALLADRFASIRRAAQKLLGISTERATPWPVMVAPAARYLTTNGQVVERGDADIVVRAMTGSVHGVMHKAFMGTGACCTAVAACTPGTVVNDVMMATADKPSSRDSIILGHPSGTISIEVEVRASMGTPEIGKVVFERTARPIMRGEIFVRKQKVHALAHQIPLDQPCRSGVPG